jgi:Uncharacterised protein family (UPF0236)
MGCAAEIIALDDVRASQQRQGLRQQLHERFDQWLDEVEAQLSEAEPTLAQVSETIWSLRQGLTASVAQTLIEQSHPEERYRQALRCPTCDRLLSARPAVSRTVRTLVGDLEIERPYFYCRYCCEGAYPLDAVLGLCPGQIQRDVQQAAADLATELPYETASALLGRLSGISVSSERLHTLTNQVAEGLSVLDVAPSRDAIDQRVAQVAAGRFRRPVLVLGIDGAYVPSRPESARGRRPGQARYRARRALWRHAWYEAKGFRFYLLDADRIVHVLSWHQVQSEDDLGKALKQIKDEGLIPEETVRLCVIGDGADWIWKHVQALFPGAYQVLDYYHCSQYLHRVAGAQYGHTLQALEWVEATLTRLYHGQVGAVLGGLRRMQPTSEEAAKAITNCWIHLREHRGRTHYGKLRRGGYPLGSGGIESSNKFICHVRLKRSGAWWYEASSNQMLALRCAKYNGTFDQVFARYRQKKNESVRIT